MKRLLITPQATVLGKVDRQYTTTTLTDFLLDSGYIPMMAHFHSVRNDAAYAEEIAQKYVETFAPHGIILQGGDDVSPALYGQERQHAMRENLLRDMFESALICIALRENIPMFGICRGMQLINVVMGGDLHQHLDEEKWGLHMKMDEEGGTHILDKVQLHTHPIALEEHGVLYKHVQTRDVVVNSFHHQGIQTLASEVQVEARAASGLIEAYSCEEKSILGVQWHPELPADEKDAWWAMHLWLSWIEKKTL